MKRPETDRLKKNIRQTLLLVIVAVVFAASAVAATVAGLNVFSDDYNTRFALNHIGVTLVENGLDKSSQDRLLSALADSVIPGKKYEETIAAKNTQNVEELVRITIRTYWMKDITNSDGDVVKVKDTELDPSLIRLTYGDKEYNDSAWEINPEETTEERRTYYYRTVLGPSGVTEPVIDTICVSEDILDSKIEETKVTDSGETIKIWSYEYDGKAICVEADVQSIQVNSGNDAIHSLWGVPNIGFSDGKVAVGIEGKPNAAGHKFTGECSYTGRKIKSTFDSDSIEAEVGNLQPGDDLTYTITYVNRSDEDVDWYMRNEVLETLEDNKEPAENGGYTYILKNIGPDGKETVLFSNDRVGGESRHGNLEGLRQATSAVKNYFFIQNLSAGESGKTVLYVKFDGETHVNDYMDSYGRLMMSYAVQNGNGDTSESDHSISVKTGDMNRLMMFAVIFAAALLMLAATVMVRRYLKTKGGEER